MARAFLLTVDTTRARLRALMDHVDAMPSVSNGLTFLPGAAVLVSALDLEGLNGELRRAFPEQRCLLVELDDAQRNGWLPRKVWDFINQPAAAPA